MLALWHTNCRNAEESPIGRGYAVTISRLFRGWAVLLLLLAAPVDASSQTAPDPAPPVAVENAAPVKLTKMSATARVLELTGTSMKVERTVKGTAEIMEFALDRPAPKIAVGDKVRITYVTKDGRLVAVRVFKAAAIDAKKVKRTGRSVAP